MNPLNPAFPISGDAPIATTGMNIRTYIAARAMAAYIGNEPWLKEANEVSHNNPILLAGMVARVACMQADHLIAALSQSKGKTELPPPPTHQ